MCIGGLCECDAKLVKCTADQERKPDGKCQPIKCLSNQEHYLDGSCGPILQKCPNVLHMNVNGKCQEVECGNDDQCAAKFQSYCTKFKLGQSICRSTNGVCGCNGQKSYIDKKIKGTCNYNLGDSDKCGQGNICLPYGKCGPRPKCAFIGDTCHPQTNKCCDSSAYCHQRLGYSSPSCVRTAFVKESCSSGIPCERDSFCINGKCSLRFEDGCDFNDAVCPPNYKCKHTALRAGTNKICMPNL